VFAPPRSARPATATHGKRSSCRVATPSGKLRALETSISRHSRAPSKRLWEDEESPYAPQGSFGANLPARPQTAPTPRRSSLSPPPSPPASRSSAVSVRRSRPAVPPASPAPPPATDKESTSPSKTTSSGEEVTTSDEVMGFGDPRLPLSPAMEEVVHGRCFSVQEAGSAPLSSSASRSSPYLAKMSPRGMMPLCSNPRIAPNPATASVKRQGPVGTVAWDVPARWRRRRVDAPRSRRPAERDTHTSRFPPAWASKSSFSDKEAAPRAEDELPTGPGGEAAGGALSPCVSNDDGGCARATPQHAAPSRSSSAVMRTLLAFLGSSRKVIPTQLSSNRPRSRGSDGCRSGRSGSENSAPPVAPAVVHLARATGTAAATSRARHADLPLGSRSRISLEDASEKSFRGALETVGAGEEGGVSKADKAGEAGPAAPLACHASEQPNPGNTSRRTLSIRLRNARFARALRREGTPTQAAGLGPWVEGAVDVVPVLPAGASRTANRKRSTVRMVSAALRHWRTALSQPKTPCFLGELLFWLFAVSLIVACNYFVLRSALRYYAFSDTLRYAWMSSVGLSLLCSFGIIDVVLALTSHHADTLYRSICTRMLGGRDGRH